MLCCLLALTGILLLEAEWRSIVAEESQNFREMAEVARLSRPQIQQ